MGQHFPRPASPSPASALNLSMLNLPLLPLLPSLPCRWYLWVCALVLFGYWIIFHALTALLLSVTPGEYWVLGLCSVAHCDGFSGLCSH